MKRKLTVITSIMVVSMIIAGVAALRDAPKEETFEPHLPTEKVTIETKAGEKHVVTLEIAKEPVDLEVGLMHRKSMPKDHGMLFYFGHEPRMVSFWMKNTLIPLDMIFVDEEGIIASIHPNAEPGSLESVPSVYPVTSVIELNGGETARRNIKPGDYVRLPEIDEKEVKSVP